QPEFRQRRGPEGAPHPLGVKHQAVHIEQYALYHRSPHIALQTSPLSVSLLRHAPGGTHFCPHTRDRNSFPLVSPWGQNLVLNRALAAKRLAHSQRQISL